MAKFSFFRSNTVKQASVLLAVTSLLSNGLGLARNLVFNRVLPQGELDVYFASFRLADLLLNLLIVGAISSAVIPTVSTMIALKKDEQARELTNQLLTWASVAMLVIIAALWTFMPQLVRNVLVPGFEDVRALETIKLSRLLLLQALFFSWSFIIGALLNSYRRFAGYALAPLLYNISLISGGLLASRYGVISLIYAVIAGSFFHFLIQFYEVYRIGFRPRINFRFNKELRTIFALMAPRSASQGINQLILLVYTNLASRLAYGSLTVFNNMNDLQTTPTVVVANSLATASFPTLASQLSQGKKNEVNDLVTKVIRACLFILLPTAVLGLVLRAQITRLYFGIGAADWGLTMVAITTLTWFMLGIVPSALVVILSRVFYASNDTRTPMVINMVTAGLGIALSWIGINRYGADVSILALSETAIAISQASLYLLMLHKRDLVTLRASTLFGANYSYAIGSLLVGVSTWLALRLINALYVAAGSQGTERVAGLLIQTSFAAAVGLYVYFRYSSLQNKEELTWLKRRSFSKDR